MDIGSVIKSLRKDKSMSARELSRRSGVSQSYISQLETGSNHNPTTEILSKLANGLNVEHEYLFYLAGFIDKELYEQLKETRKIISDNKGKWVNVTSEIRDKVVSLEKVLKDETILQVQYGNYALTESDKKDIIKFIETFILNK